MSTDQEPRRYTRRKILTAPFDHFKDSEVSTTDTIVEYSGEALSIMGMLYLAYRGSQDQLVTYEVKAENRLKNLPEFPEIQVLFQKFSSILDPMHYQVRSLNSAWQAYDHYECHTELVTTTDSDGDTETKPEEKCEYVWREPFALTSLGIDHYRVSGWENAIGGFNNSLKSNQEQAPEAFDLSNNGSSLYYSEKSADIASQLWIAGLAFGVVGGAFCTYEEALHHMTDDGYGNAFIDDKKYIKRRTFLKLAAAGLLSFKIRDLQKAFASENKELLSEIKENTAKVFHQMDAPSDINFKRVMGGDALGIRNTLVDIRERSQTVLAKYSGFLDGDWYKVRPALENTNAQAKTSLKLFDELFQYESGSYQIPQAMDLANRYLYGTREIKKFASSKSATIYTRHLTDALLMALGLGAVAILGEKAIFPLSDKLIRSES